MSSARRDARRGGTGNWRRRPKSILRAVPVSAATLLSGVTARMADHPAEPAPARSHRSSLAPPGTAVQARERQKCGSFASAATTGTVSRADHPSAAPGGADDHRRGTGRRYGGGARGPGRMATYTPASNGPQAPGTRCPGRRARTSGAMTRSQARCAAGVCVQVEADHAPDPLDDVDHPFPVRQVHR
jgi:hypothetical protein